jgi:hypothetical protein
MQNRAAVSLAKLPDLWFKATHWRTPCFPRIPTKFYRPSNVATSPPPVLSPKASNPLELHVIVVRTRLHHVRPLQAKAVVPQLQTPTSPAILRAQTQLPQADVAQAETRALNLRLPTTPTSICPT